MFQPNGYYVQIYRGAVKGATSADRLASMDNAVQELSTLGVKGIAWHGFIGDLDAAHFDNLAKITDKYGLVSLAAFGLGSGTPIEKGTFIGHTAQHPKCVGTLFDMEGAWEKNAQCKLDAKIMGDTFRALCPKGEYWVTDQPWFAPMSHGSFPWDETSAFVDCRSPQVYVNDFTSQYGEEAYSKVWAWYERDWATLEARLGPKELVRPRLPTIQGYKWDLKDLVACLTANPTLFIWSEPYPDAVMKQGLDTVQRLAKRGFTGVNAVQLFQSDFNTTSPENAKLSEDNHFGPMTARALGVAV